VHPLPPLPRFELARMYRTYQSYLNDALARIGPDVVHGQGSNCTGYVAVRAGYPAVITVYGIRSKEIKYIERLATRLRDRLEVLLIERYSLTHARHLIVNSRYTTACLSSLLRPGTQAYCIPNAVDESYFDLKGTADGHTLLFVGRVLPIKRVLDLVKAFGKIAQRLPQAQLRIVGECQTEPAYVETIRAFIREAGLNDQVHLLGSVSEEAILREYAACDVLVLASAQENVPMVIAQAMAAGKPVIATRVGGVAEMVRDGETGFLTAVGDVEGLASALLRLLQDPPLRARMGQAGKQFALVNYHITTIAGRTYEVYRNIVATRR
jgi:glycosyltransferase involved in cell wall biosynthesis